MTHPVRLAIFGYPVEHSRSPELQQLFARQCGIELSYEKLEVPPGMLSAMLPAFALNGGIGGNVTLPHKEDAFDLAQITSERARLAGSANTLKRMDDGNWSADNTDGAGFISDLTQNLDFDPGGKQVLLIGAGGAARGVLQALLGAGAERVMMVNRTLTRAQTLVADCDPKRVGYGGLADAAGTRPYDLVVNTTSAGLSGEVPPLPDGLFANDALAYDLIYGEGAQPFLRWAKGQGVEALSDGFGMFVEQGALSFEFWFGVRPETKEIDLGFC